MIDRWPRSVLPSQEPMFHLAPMNVSGPVSRSQASDIISGDAGLWIATLGNVVVTTRDRVLTWQALAARLRGRRSPIVVPLCRTYQPVVAGYDKTAVPHSDGTFFSDGTGYVGAGTDVRTTEDLPARAVSATVVINYAGAILPGAKFSFGKRLYEVESVTGNTIMWMPPLREPVPAGTELNFTAPQCQMRLATDNEMMLPLDAGRRGIKSVSFVEDLVS